MEANKFVVNMKANKFVVNMKANKFTKEKEKQSLELFHITLKYIIFCYQELKKDNKNYSRSLCETTESSEFEERVGLIHRLDKDTSGVLLIAKTEDAFENLKDQFKTRGVSKQYLVVVLCF